MFNPSSCTPLCCTNKKGNSLGTYIVYHAICLNQNERALNRTTGHSKSCKYSHEFRGKHFDFCIFGNRIVKMLKFHSMFKIKQFRPIQNLKLPYYLLTAISVYRFQMGIFPIPCNRICINNCI